MTTAAEMRNAIMASLADLQIGKLHAYERYTTNNKVLRDLYQDEETDRINGWNLRRAGFRKTPLGEAMFLVRSNWVITGYMSLQDEEKTELSLDLQADQISDALSLDITFGIGNWMDDYAQEAEAEPVMFAGVLSHQVKISFPTLHEQAAGVSDALADFLTMSVQYDIPPHVVAAQHAKWLQEPTPDYSASKPELSEQFQIREE